MISFIDFKETKVVGIAIEGKIDKEALEKFKASINKTLEENEMVNLYIELRNFEGFSPKAFFDDLQFAVQNWGKVKKEALVTIVKWMQKLMPLVNTFTPSVEVQTFAENDKKAAKNWIVF